MKLSVAAKRYGIPEPTLRAAALANKLPSHIDQATGIRLVRGEDVQAWKDDPEQHKPGRKSSS